MSAGIEFRNVGVAAGSGPRLLEDISFSVEEGTTTAVLGRSGSGKTTLLRTVNRMVEPTWGDVLVRGKSVREGDVIALRRSMGYVIQETGLFPHYDAERNVGLVLEAEGGRERNARRRSRMLLNAVGLEAEEFGKRYPHQLSGGQRQRVGLARALAAEPDILLMDEPFGALDPLTRAEMQDMLRELMARMRKTVLLVTHDLDEALYAGGPDCAAQRRAGWWRTCASRSFCSRGIRKWRRTCGRFIAERWAPRRGKALEFSW